MKSGVSANQLWTQQPVASRLVEVNTKTGFSLTAGSYIVRASSSQRGNITITSSVSNTATISSVTTTRAQLAGGGNAPPLPTGSETFNLIAYVFLTNATTVTCQRIFNGAPSTNGVFDVMELF
jgi:hypothetical protein